MKCWQAAHSFAWTSDGGTTLQPNERGNPIHWSPTTVEWYTNTNDIKTWLLCLMFFRIFALATSKLSKSVKFTIFETNYDNICVHGFRKPKTHEKVWKSFYVFFPRTIAPQPTFQVCRLVPMIIQNPFSDFSKKSRRILNKDFASHAYPF